MKVRELMTEDVRCCQASESLSRAAQLMWEHDFGCVPVVDSAGRIQGMITDRDLAMAAYTKGQPLAALPVGEAMSASVQSVRPDDDVAVAHERMRSHAVRRLPVADDDGRLVGLVGLNDLARAAGEAKGKSSVDAMAEVARTLGRIGRPRSSD